MLFLAFAATFLIFWAVVYATLPAIRHLGQLLARLIARSAHATRFVSNTRERYRNYLPVAATLAAAPRDNPQTSDKIALGEKLFFDGRLSVDGTVSCATCHPRPWRARSPGSRPCSCA